MIWVTTGGSDVEEAHLSIPAWSAQLGNLIRLTMRNDTLFDIKSFDDVYPRLVIQMENSLVFRNILILNLLAWTRNSRIFVRISLVRQWTENNGILTEGR